MSMPFTRLFIIMTRNLRGPRRAAIGLKDIIKMHKVFEITCTLQKLQARVNNTLTLYNTKVTKDAHFPTIISLCSCVRGGSSLGLR